MNVIPPEITVNECIFRPDGIHGIAETELTPAMYRKWGAALGSLVKPGAKFLVGSDIRESSPRFLASLIEGLQSSGAAVVNLGVLPTSMVYYGLTRTGAAGCAIVTGDDAPARYNGLRWQVNSRPPCPEHFALFDVFDEETRSSVLLGPGPEPRELDITFDYVAWFQETWFDTPAMPLHVVVDPMYGSWAGKVRRYLQAVFPCMFFTSVRNDPDPTFQGGTPSGLIRKQLDFLSWEADHRRADIGFAFDADGGRLTLVDGYGIPLQPEKTACFLLESFGSCLKGELVLHDAGCSRLLLDRLHQAGAETQVVRRDQTPFWQIMGQSGAVFGIETGGHFYFRCFRGNEDPLFTACWVLDYLTTLMEKGQTFTKWRAQSPHFSITPEIRLPISELDAVAASISRRWNTEPETLDEGLCWTNDAGWLLAREQRDLDAIDLRVEGADKKQLYSLLCQTAAAIDEAGFSGKSVLRGFY